MKLEFDTETILKSKIKIIDQEIDPQTFNFKEMPSDCHLVVYKVGDVTCTDVVRAYNKVDVFDIYYDRIKNVGALISIDNGYGSIKPRLFDARKE